MLHHKLEIAIKRAQLSAATYLTLVLILAFAAPQAAVPATQSSTSDRGPLSVNISLSKPSYILGEIVSISAEVKNASEASIHIHGATVRSGYLRLFVAGKDQHFREYGPPGNTPKTPGPLIKPGGSVKSQTTLLWNRNPAKSFANTRLFEQSHIMTDLAFPEAGVYFIKAVLIVPHQFETLKIESDLAQVVINEATGDDLLVWERIRKNSDIAYFLQASSILASKTEDQVRLLKEIEELIEESPVGLLAQQARQSLSKFRENEARSKKYIERLKQQQGLQS